MPAGVIAELLVLLHFAFIFFAVFGGLLVWRWRGLAWLHLPAVLWGGWIELSGRICPLTPLENQFRRLAGEGGYAGDFIGQYLLPVVYPTGLTHEVQLLLGGGLLLFNLLVYGGLLWRLRRKKRARHGDGPQLLG